MPTTPSSSRVVRYPAADPVTTARARPGSTVPLALTSSHPESQSSSGSSATSHTTSMDADDGSTCAGRARASTRVVATRRYPRAARTPAGPTGSTSRPTRNRAGREVLPVGLDGVLAARGYRLVATTRVLALALPAQAEPSAASIEVADEPDDDWLSGWLDVKASGTVDPDLARAVVTGSAAGYLTTRDDDGVVGVIRAGYSGDWVGLSCLMVAQRAQRARRRGLARALTLAAMQIAAERGARRAFLQVEDVNHAALE